MYPKSDPFLGSQEFSDLMLPKDDFNQMPHYGTLTAMDNGEMRIEEDALGVDEKEDLDALARRVYNLEAVVRSMIPYVQSIPMASLGKVEIKKSHLDHHCLALFQQAPDPSGLQLTNIAKDLEEAYPALERREILSATRKWFRKRREEVGMKALAALKKVYGRDMTASGRTAAQFMAAIENGKIDLQHILADSKMNLEITPAVEAFCRQKIISFLGKNSARSNQQSQ